MSTKIHAATIDENCSVALQLTAGHAHDGRQFESLYESLDPDNVLESATMDKGYDADRIRERLRYDGVEAVIPPIPTRARKLPYDHARYRERNRIERFFNKLKHFRRIATRYDKLAKTFFAALCSDSWHLRHELRIHARAGLAIRLRGSPRHNGRGVQRAMVGVQAVRLALGKGPGMRGIELLSSDFVQAI